MPADMILPNVLSVVLLSFQLLSIGAIVFFLVVQGRRHRRLDLTLFAVNEQYRQSLLEFQKDIGQLRRNLEEFHQYALVLFQKDLVQFRRDLDEFRQYALVEFQKDLVQFRRDVAEFRQYALESSAATVGPNQLSHAQARALVERQERFESILPQLERGATELRREAARIGKQSELRESLIEQLRESFVEQLLPEISARLGNQLAHAQEDLRLLILASESNDFANERFQRILPVSLYTSIEDPETTEAVEKATRELMDAIGFEVVREEPPRTGSWHKKLWFKAKEGVSAPEVQKRLAKVERAVELKHLDGVQSKIDLELSQAVLNLRKALDNVPEGIISIGSLFAVKLTPADGKPRLAVLSLTQEQMALVKSNPQMQTDPAAFFSILENCKQTRSGDGLDLSATPSVTPAESSTPSLKDNPVQLENNSDATAAKRSRRRKAKGVEDKQA
jgi:hypothetical protein